MGAQLHMFNVMIHLPNKYFNSIFKSEMRDFVANQVLCKETETICNPTIFELCNIIKKTVFLLMQ